MLAAVGLKPGDMLSNLFLMVPELTTFANLDLKVIFNKARWDLMLATCWCCFCVRWRFVLWSSVVALR